MFTLPLLEAAPLLDALREELKTTLQHTLPKSTTGKAANYTLTLWHKLTRFLEHPELELSNNRAENSMRPHRARTPERRTEDCSHPLRPRILPQTPHQPQTLPRTSPPRTGQQIHPTTPQTHIQCLHNNKYPINTSWVALTDTLQQHSLCERLSGEALNVDKRSSRRGGMCL